MIPPSSRHTQHQDSTVLVDLPHAVVHQTCRHALGVATCRLLTTRACCSLSVRMLSVCCADCAVSVMHAVCVVCMQLQPQHG
jgi:hypothetical protein